MGNTLETEKLEEKERKRVAALEKSEEHRNNTSDEHTIVSKIGYLIGVQECFFTDNGFCMDARIAKEMNTNKDARIIRNLCALRSSCERGFLKFSNAITFELKNLNSIDYTENFVKTLHNDGMEIIKANPKMEDYIIMFNKLITENIDKCKPLFPDWVEWKYIRELFIVKGDSVEKNKKVFTEYISHSIIYPFQQFIVWKFMPDEGNILYSDKKFLTRLYEQHHDSFSMIQNVCGAGIKTQRSIASFVDESNKVVMLVDCENCDPLRLCAALDEIDITTRSKISNIILYNDVNASSAWNLLEKHTKASITHQMTQRIKLEKSLVDIELTAGACKEHYQNNVDSFMLASSDSDFWGMIRSLPTAKFLVLVEKEKVSNSVLNVYEEKEIPYCFLNDFCQAGASYQMRTDAILSECTVFISERLQDINTSAMLSTALQRTRITMTEKEKKQFYDKCIKTLHVEIAENGIVQLKFSHV